MDTKFEINLKNKGQLYSPVIPQGGRVLGTIQRSGENPPGALVISPVGVLTQVSPGMTRTLPPEASAAFVLASREFLGLTPRDFAQALGKAPGGKGGPRGLQDWEAGRRKVPGASLLMIAELVSVDPVIVSRVCGCGCQALKKQIQTLTDEVTRLRGEGEKPKSRNLAEVYSEEHLKTTRQEVVEELARAGYVKSGPSGDLMPGRQKTSVSDWGSTDNWIKADKDHLPAMVGARIEARLNNDPPRVFTALGIVESDVPIVFTVRRKPLSCSNNGIGFYFTHWRYVWCPVGEEKPSVGKWYFAQVVDANDMGEACTEVVLIYIDAIDPKEPDISPFDPWSDSESLDMSKTLKCGGHGLDFIPWAFNVIQFHPHTGEPPPEPPKEKK